MVLTDGEPIAQIMFKDPLKVRAYSYTPEVRLIGVEMDEHGVHLLEDLECIEEFERILTQPGTSGIMAREIVLLSVIQRLEMLVYMHNLN